MHFVHVNSELQSMYGVLVCKPTSEPAPLPYICFSPIFRFSVCLHVHFQVDNFLLSEQNVMCTHGFVLQSDWYMYLYRQSNVLTGFPVDVTRLSPCFWESLVTRLGRKRGEKNEYVYVYSRKSLRTSVIQTFNYQTPKIMRFHCALHSLIWAYTIYTS